MKPIQIISQDVFDKIRSRFENLEMGDETGAVTIDPAEARFFDFDFIFEGNNLGRVSISLQDIGNLKIYYSRGITEGIDDFAKQVWFNFLKEMRMFAKRRLLRFDTRDIAKDNLDRNDFQYLANKNRENEMPVAMNESRWTNKSTKKTSRAIAGTTEVIVRHSQPVDEMYKGARSQKKYIKAIFIQNKDGERFKYPFIHPAGAFAMAQHVDHGGVPHDPAGKAIMKMSEEIAQLQAFDRHVQKSQLHDDAIGITEKTHQRLIELKKKIAALGKRHYYENWIAEFNEQEVLEDLTELDSVTIEDYKAKFTQTNFQEDLLQFFPLIHRIMQETNTINLEEYVNEETGNDAITLDGKEIDYTSLEIEGVNIKDHPDYTDAYFSYGEYMDGTPLTDEELNRLTDERGDIVNRMAHDSMNESNDPMQQFEAWASAVEQGKLTTDQIEDLSKKLNDLSEPMELGPDGSNAINFFQEVGLDNEDLKKAFVTAAEVDPTQNAFAIFVSWAEENYPDLLAQLGIPPKPAQEEEPKENDEMQMPPGVMNEDKSKSMIKEVAKIVHQYYNKDNPEVGPFRGNEGICIEVEKKCAEMFGEEAGQKARELAETFIQKLTDEWEARHYRNSSQDPQEGIGDQGHNVYQNIMPAEEIAEDLDIIKKLSGLAK